MVHDTSTDEMAVRRAGATQVGVTQVSVTQAGITVEDDYYRLMVENATDIIVRGDAARNRTYVSPASRDILGYEPAELLGRHAYELIHPDDFGSVDEVFRSVGAARPSLMATFRMRRRNGSYVWIEGRYRHLPGDDGILAILRDISAQKRAEDLLADAYAKLEEANGVLRALAHQDGLTGIANRRRFDELADEELRRARRQELPLALVLFDVDCFKAYNDRYGHLAGDDCLRRIGRAMTASVRRPGDHVARYGGEEFVALLPATDLCGARRVAEDMREAVLGLALPHEDSPFGRVTVSAGAAAITPLHPADDVPGLVGAADRALYQAKATGRNRVAITAIEHPRSAVEVMPVRWQTVPAPS